MFVVPTLQMWMNAVLSATFVETLPHVLTLRGVIPVSAPMDLPLTMGTENVKVSNRTLL